MLEGAKRWLPTLGVGGLLPAGLTRIGPMPAGAMAAAMLLLFASAGYVLLLGADPQATGPRFMMAMPRLAKGPDKQALITPPPAKTGGQEAPAPTFPPAVRLPPITPVAVPTMPADLGRPPPSFAALPVLPAATPLSPAPLPELLRETPKGKLPVIAADGRMPSGAYARPFAADGRPMVAVVVTGLGLDPDATRAAITRLPPEVSLAFSPYAAGLDEWIKSARAAGHEVLVTLPMEPLLFPAHDEGPLAVTANMPAAAAVDRVEDVLTKAVGYVGVVGPRRSPVAATDTMSAVVAALRERGLIFVSDTMPPQVPADLQAALVTATIDVQPFRGAVDAQLSRVTALAQTQGSAVAVASPLPVTFERLAAWAPSLAAAGVALAPVSAVAAAGRGR